MNNLLNITYKISYSFSESNYNAGKCGKGHTLTGDITQGDPEYDAARANMKEPWMMFTKTQGQELIDHTNSEWTTINGVNGRKFTSKTDSSKYIFLPAGGWWNDTDHGFAGSIAYYWSATIYPSDTSHAWSLYFYSGNLSKSDDSRRLGFSIRSIHTKILQKFSP